MKKYPNWADPWAWLLIGLCMSSLLFYLHAGLFCAAGLVTVEVIWLFATVKIRRQLRNANTHPIFRSSWRNNMRYYSGEFVKGWKGFWTGLWNVVVVVMTFPFIWFLVALTFGVLAFLWWRATGHADLQLAICASSLFIFDITRRNAEQHKYKLLIKETRTELEAKIERVGREARKLTAQINTRDNEDALRNTYCALGCAYAFGQIDLAQATVYYLNAGKLRAMETVQAYLQFRRHTPTEDLPAVCLIETPDKGWFLGWHDSNPLWYVDSFDKESWIITIHDSAYPRSTAVRLQYAAGPSVIGAEDLLNFVGFYTSSAHLAHEMTKAFGVEPLAKADGERDLGIIRNAIQYGQKAFGLDEMTVSVDESKCPKAFLSTLFDEHALPRPTAPA